MPSWLPRTCVQCTIGSYVEVRDSARPSGSRKSDGYRDRMTSLPGSQEPFHRLDTTPPRPAVPHFWISLPLCLLVMGVANVATNRFSAANVAIGVAFTVALAAIARASGLRSNDLGLARSTWLRGLRWGGACVGIAFVGYGLALLVPPIRSLMAGFGRELLAAHPGHGARGHSAGDGDTRGVRVPRGALVHCCAAAGLEQWRRRCPPPCSASGTRFRRCPAARPTTRPTRSWVAEPAASVLRTVGTIVFTAAAGVLFCELRVLAATACSHPCWRIGRSTDSARSSCSSPDERTTHASRPAVPLALPDQGEPPYDDTVQHGRTRRNPSRNGRIADADDRRS